MQNTFKQINMPYYFYKVNNNETLEDISNKLNLDVNIIINNNKLDGALENGDILYLPLENVKIHIVKPLDSLSSIANKYGVTVKEILSKNNIETLFIGQKIYL